MEVESASVRSTAKCAFVGLVFLCLQSLAVGLNKISTYSAWTCALNIKLIDSNTSRSLETGDANRVYCHTAWNFHPEVMHCGIEYDWEASEGDSSKHFRASSQKEG